MYVKLQSGFLSQALPDQSDTPASLERDALLVYCGSFESMDGLVEVKEEHLVRLYENHNAMLAKVARMMAGEVPVKNYPPIQVDHTTSGWDTVGRLVGQLRLGDHTTEDGSIVKALYGRLRILGKENVERVADGRWTNLSIGADLEKGKFQELTITPFPAAADASMLSRMGKKSEKYKGKTITIESGPGTSWYLIIEDIKRGPFQRESDAWEAAYQVVDSGVLKQFTSGGNGMWDRLKAFLMRKQNLSAEEATKKLAEGGKEFDALAKEEKDEHEKLKKYLTGHKKMSEEDADKHLSDMNMEDHKKLSAEADEHDKKLAAEQSDKDKTESETKAKKMSAARESLTKLSTDFRSNSNSVQLGMKKTKIITRLSKLKGDAKITPAEVKKIDLAKLAGESDATIEAVMKSYEDREPVIMTGMSGSKKAIDASKAYQQSRMSSLEAETRANMPLLAKAAGAKLAKLGKDGVPGKLDEQEDAPHEAVEKLEQVHKEAEKHLAKCMSAMDAGNHGEAKDHLRKLMEHYKAHLASHAAHIAHMGEEPAHKVETEMSALAENFQRMQNGFNEIMELAGSLAGTESK